MRKKFPTLNDRHPVLATGSRNKTTDGNSSPRPRGKHGVTTFLCVKNNYFHSEIFKTIFASLFIFAPQANAATPAQPSIEINLEAISNLQNPQIVAPITSATSVIPLSAPTASIRPNEATPSLPSSANTEVKPTAEPKIGYVETGAEIHSLTNKFPNWSGEYVKGEVKTSDENSWNGEFTNQKKFGDGGVYGAVGNTHIFDENWFSNISVGVGSDAIFLPRYRVDAFLNRKWGDDKSLITTVGIGTYKAQKTYDDKNISFGATYYFAEPFIVQGGIRFNRSDPKSVYSTSEYVAITQGRAQEHFITLRYGFGKEAYELQGANVGINDFYSHEASLNWRQWLSDDWGFNLRAEFYHNPSYIRRGIALGIFREF